ncbi:putative RNA polymerase ECF-type sigma factor [Nocardia brasiliensis NBRC 14402]|uniref:sigma-70 family RNA polymerase sigma factor n=1 Tax=Nocardia brasiliensis TaxID=37326 RepID=UPI0003160B37|nr:sigma-70 family RNA polymerase sigma factor [Nocardia brasiliensis]ASF07609.1 RNA polymerase subunit sigma-70 [Nocardia brasiliensis]GAJ81078.1 putative RNA polymerase ECF-type sigma factor [Nocardia brasiliensis NBRC 14402]SUB54851.1 RNA polymerase sigma factor SigJ [Nocardia brasiliensis]
MPNQDVLARRFESHRARLGAIAYRMLGSVAEAEDAVQETWLRLAKDDAVQPDNLIGWLTTVLSRICLDMLRARAARREDPLESRAELGDTAYDTDPEQEALLIDAVGRALLVVLDTLHPDERVAFVLHDLFAVPFEQIAPIVGRTPATTKKLASRARQRTRGETRPTTTELAEQRRVVGAFLAAAREGDLAALLAVLAPDVVRVADPAALPAGMAAIVRGAQAVARETVLLQRRSRVAALALVDGAVGLVVAPRGKLLLALVVTVRAERVAGYEVIADPARLRALDLGVLPACDPSQPPTDQSL